jgi:DNA-directed RNA polymerase subunit omega
MARISAQDCLERLPNRFALCILAAKRARQLTAGDPPLVVCNNKAAVTSLREIAAGRITAAESLDQLLHEHVAAMQALDAHRSTISLRTPPSENSRPRAAASKSSAR